jgi:hypothetical protein
MDKTMIVEMVVGGATAGGGLWYVAQGLGSYLRRRGQAVLVRSTAALPDGVWIQERGADGSTWSIGNQPGGSAR